MYMINTQDIEKLAKLARISVTEEEKGGLVKEIGSILAYVDEIKKVTKTSKEDKSEEIGVVYNVMREDSNPHQSGIDTEKILNEAPKREGDYLKVKKIL